MGVRARRWQLWLITTFILTGMIGMIQLFKGPESVGAVQIAGGASNPSVAIPSRSMQATELPSWTPTAQTSASSKDVDVVRAPHTSTSPAASTSSKQATQLPTTTPPGSKATSVAAKSVTPSAPASASTTKATKATSSAPKPVTTTTQAKPAPSPGKSTPVTTPTSPVQPQPRCFRIFWFTFCR